MKALNEVIMENIKKYKIAYDPYFGNFSFPGNRRRFCFFAKEINLSFSKYNAKDNYDIILLTERSDLSQIKKLKKKGTTIILECIDSYLIKKPIIEDLLRYIIRQFINKRYLNMLFPKRFTSQLKEAISLVDAVVCTTEKQKNMIKKYNPNIHIILDNMDDDVLEIKSNRVNDPKTLNILWEGLPSNLINIGQVSEALNELNKTLNINLHVLTDLTSYKYGATLIKRNSADILNKYKLKVKTFFYQWNSFALSSLASNCDLAIIPLKRNKFILGKPENKLILLWKLGLPVFTSYSDAYFLTMKKAKVDMICEDKKDWVNSLLSFSNSTQAHRTKISNNLINFANKNYKKECLIKKWSLLFESIL